MAPNGTGLPQNFTSQTGFGRKDFIAGLKVHAPGGSSIWNINFSGNNPGLASWSWADLINALQLKGFDGSTYPLVDLTMDWDQIYDIVIIQTGCEMWIGTEHCRCCRGAFDLENCDHTLGMEVF